MRHDPPAIWVHLEIKTIHFWSYGPTTQYRNKLNCLLFSKIREITGQDFNCTWNMFEARHGKGIADAVGGTIKRTAYREINIGKIIDDAKSFVDAVKSNTEVKVLISLKETGRKQREENLRTLRWIL